MHDLKKNRKRRFFCLILASFFVFLQTATSTHAASYEIGNEVIVDGFTPPQNTTIIHYLNVGTKPYTKIANAVSELWVGDHHRYTVVANKRENVKIRWYSSNPEVASIKKTTGELTALSVGETTVTMWDSVNRKKQKTTLTVKAIPVLPEIPREWYTVREQPEWIAEEGVWLVLKPEYRYLYEQCSMLRIPEYVDGEKVLWVSEHNPEYFTCSLSTMGFTRLKMLQLPESMIRYMEGDANEVVFPENTKWLDYEPRLHFRKIHVPEGAELLLSNGLIKKEMGEVRIPASIKILCSETTYGYFQGVSRGENARFAVDGNNTNYYSISDVLFAYPYYSDTQNPLAKKWVYIDGLGYVYEMSAGRRTLLSYPKKKTGTVYYVPDGIERIETGAFREAYYLKKIVLPDSVTELGECAFGGMRNKVEITIPASVTVFEDGDGGPFDIVGSNDESRNHFLIITPKGSAAEAYAIKMGIPYRNE